MRKLKIQMMTTAEIEALLKSKEYYKIAARLVCILPVTKDEISRKAQEFLLLSHNQICLWTKRFEEFGVDGLKDKPKPGRKSAISSDQLDWLRNLF